ncbi:hypothetical protein OIDMADRAFT_147117 [Oidiodendron maius Zn]|uniref:Uncharacterized protein n=1 Tax=Oidiodendron maius (strain Zn) TaxID=913774 RepID=A0A0C3H8J6_OIDMZ|nr:hypothetical protein OIDMADRAFT_147117 [Oidiodendron maius Zn]
MLPTTERWFIGPQPRMELELRAGDLIFLRPPVSTRSARACSKWIRLESWSRSVERANKLGLFRLRTGLRGRHVIFQWCFQQDGDRDRGWIAIIYRDFFPDRSLGPLQISIVRVTWRTLNSEQRGESELDEVHWYHFPLRTVPGDFIAGEWPPDTDRACCSYIMMTPKDSWELKGGRHMPIIRVTTERRMMDNGVVIDLVDFQAPEVRPP